jgi:hypothetical protein
MIFEIVTVVTLESGNFSRIVSDSQEATAAAECSQPLEVAPLLKLVAANVLFPI